MKKLASAPLVALKVGTPGRSVPPAELSLTRKRPVVTTYGRRMLRTAIGAIAARPSLHRAIRIFFRSVPGLQPFVRRMLEVPPPPVIIEVDGVITLEGLCHLSRQL